MVGGFCSCCCLDVVFHRHNYVDSLIILRSVVVAFHRRTLWGPTGTQQQPNSALSNVNTHTHTHKKETKTNKHAVKRYSPSFRIACNMSAVSLFESREQRNIITISINNIPFIILADRTDVMNQHSLRIRYAGSTVGDIPHQAKLKCTNTAVARFPGEQNNF